MSRINEVLSFKTLLLGFIFFLTLCPFSNAEVGVTDQEIRIGSSLALSGQAGHLGVQYQYGANAYLNHVNDNGGVNGRKINVIWYDDVYAPPQTIANTRKLIAQDQVFCLFNYIGTQNSMKVLPILSNEKIPLVGVLSGAQVFRNPFNRYVFNIRTSYYKEVETVIDHAVNDLGLKKIAIFYQYDAYGMDGRDGAVKALEKNGLVPVAEESYLRGTMDIEEGLKNILASNAELVVMAGVAGPCAKFILEGKKRGFHPIYHNVSFVGPEKLIELLGDEGQGELLTLVVPSLEENQPVLLTEQPKPVVAQETPESTTSPTPAPVLSQEPQLTLTDVPVLSSLSGISEYESLLKQYFAVPPSTVGLEGFINAKILVEALKRCGSEMTRENFITALELIKDFDVGIGANISFSSDEHQGLDKVYVVKIDNGKMIPIVDWAELKK